MLARTTLLLVLISTLSSPHSAQAKTHTVAPIGADFTSIQAAIDASSDGDVVQIAAGRYGEELDFHGKALRVSGAGPDATVIDGTLVTPNALWTWPLVRLEGAEPSAAVLEGLTLSGASYNALSLQRSSALIRDVVITAARSESRAALSVSGGAPRFLRVTIRDNPLGAEVSVSSATFDGCRFERNGGGLRISHGVGGHARNSIFVGNTAAEGGGLSVTGTFEVTNDVFVANEATTAGGGGHLRVASAGWVVIANNILRDVAGGAAFTSSSDATHVRFAYNDLFGNAAGGGDFGGASLIRGGPGNLGVDPGYANDREVLAANSPLIDAGDPALFDADQPPSRSDVGLYGGPGGAFTTATGDVAPATWSPRGPNATRFLIPDVAELAVGPRIYARVGQLLWSSDLTPGGTRLEFTEISALGQVGRLYGFAEVGAHAVFSGDFGSGDRRVFQDAWQTILQESVHVPFDSVAFGAAGGFGFGFVGRLAADVSVYWQARAAPCIFDGNRATCVAGGWCTGDGRWAHDYNECAWGGVTVEGGGVTLGTDVVATRGAQPSPTGLGRFWRGQFRNDHARFANAELTKVSALGMSLLANTASGALVLDDGTTTTTLLGAGANARSFVPLDDGRRSLFLATSAGLAQTWTTDGTPGGTRVFPLPGVVAGPWSSGQRYFLVLRVDGVERLMWTDGVGAPEPVVLDDGTTPGNPSRWERVRDELVLSYPRADGGLDFAMVGAEFRRFSPEVTLTGIGRAVPYRSDLAVIATGTDRWSTRTGLWVVKGRFCADDALNDADHDGRCADVDNCPSAPNADQRDSDGDGEGNVCDRCPLDPADDLDLDGLCSDEDICPSVADPLQADRDGDGLGDACDQCPADTGNDADKDGRCADIDNCPSASNATQRDSDGDGAGDACDACPFDPRNDGDGDHVCGDLDNCKEIANADQSDGDRDGVGDACDRCPHDAYDDADGDGLCGDVDVCPWVADADQADRDGDGHGDACEACPDDPQSVWPGECDAPPTPDAGTPNAPAPIGPDGGCASSGATAYALLALVLARGVRARTTRGRQSLA